MANLQYYPLVQRIGIGVLCFLRPEYLVQRVQELTKFLPKASIIVFVDKYEGTNESLAYLNNKVIEEANRLIQQKLISRVVLPKMNLGVKKSFYSLANEVFLESDFFLYIEDDLQITSNPKHYLKSCIEIFDSNEKVAIACLYDNVQHLSFRKSKEIFRLTNFPKLWGVFITKNFNLEIQRSQDFRSKTVENLVSEFNIGNKKIESELISIWAMKMERSMTSATSWDTHLQYVLWNLQKYSIAPYKNFVKDLGSDTTSISRNKKKKYTILHYPKWTKTGNADFCLKCEILGLTRYAKWKSKVNLLLQKPKDVKKK